MQPQVSHIPTLEGDEIAVYTWPEPQIAPRGLVIMTHCFAEYHLRHSKIARLVRDLGYIVVGYDLYGHNQSTGRSGDLPRLDRNTTDMCTVIDHCHTQYAQLIEQGLPTIVYGVGTSALDAALISANHLRPIAGLVLVVPTFRLMPSKAQQLLLQYVPSALIHRFRFPTLLKGHELSRHPEAADAFDNDPLLVRQMSPRYYFAIERLSASVMQLASQWSTPTLVVCAENDSICDPKATIEFCEHAPQASITTCNLPGAYHHVHDDPDSGVFLQDLKSWLVKTTTE